MSDNNDVPGANDGSGDEKVTLTKAEHQALIETAANAKQSVANLTAEVIAERKAKQEALKAAEQKPVIPPSETEKIVQEALAKRDAEEVKRNQESALKKFLDSHPEFSSENDAGGIKFAAYQKALGRINVAFAKTEPDFTEALEDALRLANMTGDSRPANTFSSTPRGPSALPANAVAAQLSPAELTLVQKNFGGNVDSFLKVKAKRPAYVEELLKWVK